MNEVYFGLGEVLDLQCFFEVRSQLPRNEFAFKGSHDVRYNISVRIYDTKLWSAIRSDNSNGLYNQPSFFAHFSDCRIVWRFVRFDTPSRKNPRFDVCISGEQDSFLIVSHYDRNRRQDEEIVADFSTNIP